MGEPPQSPDDVAELASELWRPRQDDTAGGSPRTLMPEEVPPSPRADEGDRVAALERRLAEEMAAFKRAVALRHAEWAEHIRAELDTFRSDLVAVVRQELAQERSVLHSQIAAAEHRFQEAAAYLTRRLDDMGSGPAAPPPTDMVDVLKAQIHEGVARLDAANAARHAEWVERAQAQFDALRADMDALLARGTEPPGVGTVPP